MRRTPPPIDLRALQAFVAVCDSGSMTGAAKQLGVSQSAISQSIAALERDQGLTLFDHSMRLVICNQRYIEMYGLSPDKAIPGCQV